MTRPEPAQTCLCVQPQNTTIKRLHVFIYVREKLWDSSCFTFQDVIYRIPGWYLRVLPPTHPICHSVCPCMDFTTAASSSWHTYCREEGGRFTTCRVSYFHRFIWTLQKLYLNTCRTHSRDSEPGIQIVKYLEMEADFKALLIIEHSCTHLLTLLLPYMDVPDSRAARLCCQVRHCAATRDRV